MDAELAKSQIDSHRKFRRELAAPLRSPIATPEEKLDATIDLQEFRGAYRDSGYREAMRIIAEQRAKNELPKLRAGEILELGSKKTELKAKTHQESVEFPENPKEAFKYAIEVLSQPMALPIIFILAKNPGEYTETSEITSAFLKGVANTQMRNTSRETPPAYCKNTLQKHGLIAQ